MIGKFFGLAFFAATTIVPLYRHRLKAYQEALNEGRAKSERAAGPVGCYCRPEPSEECRRGCHRHSWR